MKNKIDLTIIIPIHSVSDEKFNELFGNSLMSIENNTVHPAKVLLVRCGCAEVTEALNAFDFSKYTYPIEIIENTTGKDFQTQINFGVENITTEYFSFLEFDDEYSAFWFSNVEKYTNVYSDIDMFLPIITDITSNNKFVGFTNEAAWAYNFSDKLGELNHETLLEFANINPSGMVMRTNVFKEIGGYKPSIKLTFNYEFLLRFTNSGRNIYVIPKMGYKHLNMRPGSLFWEYKNSENVEIKISPEEALFWMETAKKEFFFVEDRNIIYLEENATK